MRQPTTQLLLAAVLMAAVAGCKDGGETPPGETRTVRPPPAMGGANVWRAMRVRPQAQTATQIQAGPAHLALIRTFLDSSDSAERAGIAQSLQEEIGAVATSRAIPKAVEFSSFPGRLVEGEVGRDAQGRQLYLAVLPKDYDPSRPWPLHIDLHGGGRAGTHMTCLKHWGTSPGPFIVLCPTTFKGHWWLAQGEAMAMKVFSDALEHFNIDTDRVSVGGLSNGGNGTWHLGHKYPWLWSALVPRCAGHIHGFEYITNIMGVPVFMIHGEADSTIGVDHSRRMFSEFEARGRTITYKEVEGGGHAFFPSLNADVLPWLMRQKRQTPARFAFVPTRGQDHGIIHWLEAEGARELRAELSEGPDGVHINVVTKGTLKHLRVYLNESMVDPEQRVVVVHNKRQLFSGLAEHDAAVALETFERTRDPKRTFTARIDLPLSP